MAKRYPQWDDRWHGYERRWRANLRFFFGSAIATLAGVAGFLMLQYRPDWLEETFIAIVVLGLFATFSGFQTLRESKRENGMWWYNRPYRWWE